MSKSRVFLMETYFNVWKKVKDTIHEAIDQFKKGV